MFFMPICEMCGGDLELVDAIVEGTMLKLCKRCAKFGRVITIEKPIIKEEKIFESNRPIEEPQEVIISNYSEIIKKARELKNLKQEEVAKQIAEKESVIHNLESGNLTPSIKLAKKLEQFFRIKLIVKPEENKKESKKLDFKNNFVTIGDLLKMSKNV